MVGNIDGKKMPVFSSTASSEITEAISTSLAVPALVVIQIIGIAGFAGVFFPPVPDRE